MSWNECTLGDLITLKRGHDLPNAKRIEGSIPVVSSSGITGYHNEAKAKPPGVVTGRYGTLGEVFFLEQDYWPLNTALYVIDFKGTDPRFSAYFLKNTLKSYKSDKAAVPGVDRNVLHALKVHAPDRDTQERIVDVLSKYDDLIENNKRRIELLEESAKQLYKEWFVRFRFPSHEHVKIIDGVPEGWTKTTLGQIAATNSKNHKAKDLPKEINYIDISSVSTGRIEASNRILAEEAPGRARRIAKHGDTIWSNVRPNLKAYALVLHPDENDVFSTGFTVISGTKIPYSFLYNFTTTDNFVSHLVNHTTGASYPAVRPPDFERAEVVLPPKILLDQFHEMSEPSYEMAYMLGEQNKQLAKARDLLLPKLMSGDIAV